MSDSSQALRPAAEGGGSAASEAVPAEIVAILGRDGGLSRLRDGYEERSQQLEMASLVSRALAEGRHAVVEAGTGTGKTLAYLVPALLSGKKITVSTATKALQEQLVEKDLPLLAQMGARFRFAVMKGRQNYLCLLRREQFEAAPVFVSRDERDLYSRVRQWASTTRTGDRAELDLPDGYVAWRDVSATAETCLGQDCPRYDDCHVTRMRRDAQEADVVVVNHHLFFADLALRRSPAARAGAEVIPRTEAVILDEAHNVEEVATEFFGQQTSNYRFFDLCRDIERVMKTRETWPNERLERATSALGRSADAFFRAVSALAPEEAITRRTDGPERIPKSIAAPVKVEKAPLPTTISLFDRPRTDAPREVAADDAEILARSVVVDAATKEAADGERRESRWALEPGSLDSVVPLRDALLLELRAVQSLFSELLDDRRDPEAEGFNRRCEELRLGLETTTRPGEGEYVYWAEQRGRGVFLRASPVDVAGFVSGALFFDERPVVMTSATLAAGGNTSFFRRRIGLPNEAEDRPAPLEAVLPSPFDYSRQASLYLPRHLPEPTAADFIERAVEEIAALIALASGRTFALFTSFRAMNEAHRRLAPRIPYQVLLQGERPKSVLLRAFREKPSVLFATQSFWEGVDVPGDSLSMVIIDKLPFGSPGDPLLAARMKAITDRGGSAFGEYQLPSAAITLKQGFGRLIRTRTDSGAVAILDRRLWTRSYGGYFRRSLPACPTFDRFADLKTWWKDERGRS